MRRRPERSWVPGLDAAPGAPKDVALSLCNFGRRDLPPNGPVGAERGSAHHRCWFSAVTASGSPGESASSSRPSLYPDTRWKDARRALGSGSHAQCIAPSVGMHPADSRAPDAGCEGGVELDLGPDVLGRECPATEALHVSSVAAAGSGSLRSTASRRIVPDSSTARLRQRSESTGRCGRRTSTYRRGPGRWPDALVEQPLLIQRGIISA